MSSRKIDKIKSCALLLAALVGQALLVVSSTALNSKTNTYCVSENRSCNASCGECQPLMWFVNRTQTIQNSSTIIFLPGNHSLNSQELKCNARVNFLNKDNLTLVGIGSAKEPSTVVCTGNQSGFSFQNSSNITIENLHFQNCGASMPNHFYGCVFFEYSYHISISQVFISGCKGFGLHTNNVCGNILIQYSVFTGSKSGNAVFWFKHCRENTTRNLPPTKLDIHKSCFLEGKTETQNATGIYLIILRSGVKVNLTELEVKRNKGQSGGNLAIQLYDYAQDTSAVTIEHCCIEDGFAYDSGGGMNLWFEKTWEKDPGGDCKANQTHNRTVLTVKNTTFRGNRAHRGGGGALVTYNERPGTGRTVRQVEFINCTFTNNTAARGSAIEISKHKVPIHLVHNVPQFSVTLKNSTIKKNFLQPKGDQYDEEGTVEVFSVEDFEIISSNFTNNNGTALMLVNSGVQFFKEIVFANNSAQYGGAIKLCESSVIYFDNDTRIEFVNNSASAAGGAIYAGNQCPQEIPFCFFQFSFNTSNAPPTIDKMAMDILHFEGNRAGIAGMAIYGGSVDNCSTYTELRNNSHDNGSYFNSLALFNRIFNFSNRNEPSLITSDPYGVCLCNKTTNETNCDQRQLNLTSYAGEQFTITVSAVGQTQGVVPSNILIEPKHEQNDDYEVDKMNSQEDSYKFCHTLKLAVRAKEHVRNATIRLGVVQTNAVSESSNYYKIPKLIVNVIIPPCPFLFELNKSNSCDCPKHLRNKQVRCDITTETVTRQKNIWINCTLNESKLATDNKCESVAVSDACQEDRCSSSHIVLTQTNFSEICVAGRKGRICGECKSDYSLSLGQLDCVNTEDNCSAWRTALLLFTFFLAGIMLVCFLTIFNLTVAEGTINGLLFYANCMHANQDLLYKHGTQPTLFSVFIAWLNLDFGFQVCFYSRMTAYQKMWLEFGFLFYLFLLGVLIVCLSRKFIWFTRLTGRNIVPVLSTMILLAYPKVVRNCIKIWNCHKDKYWSTDNSTPWIWHSDETIDCFTGKHLPLFILSLILFIAAFLYTLCLLFIQCLQRGSSWYVLRWVNKLRPFFDANTGPCRNHHQFWPGFLLFARLGLYLAFWRLSKLGDRSSLLLAFCVLIFFLACVSPNGIYKKWPLNLLEFSFFFNMAIVTGTAAINPRSYNDALDDTSIAIAAFTFLLILIYHSYKKLRETKKWKKMVSKIQERRNRRRLAKQVNDTESSPLIFPGQERPSVIQFTALREPILEDD